MEEEYRKLYIEFWEREPMPDHLQMFRDFPEQSIKELNQLIKDKQLLSLRK